MRKIHPMYFLLLSAVLFASSASVSQTYQNLVPPAGIATSAGEPSIGVNWNTGKILFAGRSGDGPRYHQWHVSHMGRRKLSGNIRAVSGPDSLH